MDPSDLTRTVRTKITVCACGCWVWTGAVNSKGYASAKLRGRTITVHRYTYEQQFGDLDDSLTIDHLCDRHRACVNPHHFEQVSRSENSVRANERRWHSEVDRSMCDVGFGPDPTAESTPSSGDTPENVDGLPSTNPYRTSDTTNQQGEETS